MIGLPGCSSTLLLGCSFCVASNSFCARALGSLVIGMVLPILIENGSDAHLAVHDKAATAKFDS
jgi:hypothetical protein